MAKVAIGNAGAPIPVAAYSQAVRKANILQVAGQVGIDPETGQVAGSTVAEQERQVLANLDAVLAAGGSGSGDLMMVRVYLTDAAHFAAFNEVYNAWAQEPYPARTTIYAGLAPGLLVEIDALAVLDQ